MATEVQGLFKEDDFEKACLELFNPDIDGWEHFVETHGVTIYRLYNEESGLYKYKIYGEMDVKADICADVYMDLKYRKEWDTYAKELEVRNCDGKNLIYWNVNFPFPLSNRDYVYGRELSVLEKEGNKIWVVLAQSVKSDALPPKKGLVRVDEYLQSAALTSNGKGGTKAFLKYYDNPGGNIPKWLINWAAKTGVPQFLSIMQKACEGYPDYLQKIKDGAYS